MKEASDGVARNGRCWVWVGFIQLLELYVVLIVSPDLEQQANMRNVKQRYFCIDEFVLHHNELQKPQHSPGCWCFGEQPRIWPSSF